MLNQVIDFWFEEITAAQWWKKDADFDAQVTQRFASTLDAALAGELADWRVTALGRLAEIIVLDQFSRNIFRNDARSFAADPMALALAQQSVALGVDRSLPSEQRCFLYMPYMHSESRWVHERAVPLFTALGQPSNLEFELKHKAIIDRFGRYPHRNALLGRTSTAEELAFLEQPGSSF